MKNSPYTNIAFISYKREDEEWAKWLQKKLEHYKLPTEIRKQNPDLEFAKNPRHVFKDTTDLSGGVLARAIKEGLDSSKFLIVICSPRAVKSKWVCKEVQDFIDSGREEYIIPFIIDGEPYSKNPEKECFPEALKTLAGERELLGINVKENGRDAATIKVISKLFNLRFDALWQRFRREKQNRKYKIIVFTILFFSFLIAATTLLYYQRQEALRSNWRMQESISFIASKKAKALIEEGNLYEAITLCMEVMPSNLDNPEIPYVWQVEAVLRDAFSRLCNADGEKVAEIEVMDKNGYRLRDAMIIPGQKYICLEDYNGTGIVDIESGELLYKLPGRFCRFSADGRLLIALEQKDSTYQEHKFSVYKLSSGEIISKSEYADMTVVGFTPDSKNIVCMIDDGSLHIYDTNTAKIKMVIKSNAGRTDIIDNEELLVYNRERHSRQVYNIQNGKLIFEITPEKGRNLGNTFICDSLLICVTTLKNKVRDIYHYKPILYIYNSKTGDLINKTVYPQNKISNHIRCTFDKDGFVVFSDNLVDCSLNVYSIRNNHFTAKIKTNGCKNLFFGSDKHLYIESNDGIYKWDVINGSKKPCTLSEMYKSYRYLLRYPEQEEKEGIFNLYQLNNNNPLMDKILYNDEVTCFENKNTLSQLWDKYGGEGVLIFPSKCSYFIISDSTGSVIYSKNKNNIISHLDSLNVTNVEFSKNCKFLYAYLENSIAKFSTETGKMLWESKIAKLTSGSCDGLISISENDQYVVALSEARYICVFEVGSNKLVKKLRVDHILPRNSFMDNVAIDNSGKYVFIADSYHIYIFDMDSEQIIQTYNYPATEYEYGWTFGNLFYDNINYRIKYYSYSDNSKIQFEYSFLPTSVLMSEVNNRMHNRHLTVDEKDKYHISR